MTTLYNRTESTTFAMQAHVSKTKRNIQCLVASTGAAQIENNEASAAYKWRNVHFELRLSCQSRYSTSDFYKRI